MNDRRFAGRGFKRQTPVGQHICDFVSFPLRLVIDVIPAKESEAAAQARADKHAWLKERGYQVMALPSRAIDADIAASLEGINLAIGR